MLTTLQDRVLKAKVYCLPHIWLSCFLSQETSDNALSCSDILHYPNIAIATAQMFLLTGVKFYKQNKYQKLSMV